MHFQKQDLLETHYTWASQINIPFNGQPGFRTFNPDCGDQVLFMINFYGSLSQRISIGESLRMEWQLTHALPENLNTEVEVFNWLRQQ